MNSTAMDLGEQLLGFLSLQDPEDLGMHRNEVSTQDHQGGSIDFPMKLVGGVMVC